MVAVHGDCASKQSHACGPYYFPWVNFQVVVPGIQSDGGSCAVSLKWGLTPSLMLPPSHPPRVYLPTYLPASLTHSPTHWLLTHLLTASLILLLLDSLTHSGSSLTHSHSLSCLPHPTIHSFTHCLPACFPPSLPVSSLPSPSPPSSLSLLEVQRG